MKYIALNLFVFTIFGCSNLENNNVKHEYSLKESQKLSFVIDSNTNYKTLMIQSFEENLAIESRENNSIQFYNKKNRKKSREIFLEKFGDNGVGKIRGFYIEALDSIYVIGSHKKSIALVNKQGLVLDNVSVYKEGIGLGTFYGSTFFPLLKKKNKLYATTLPDINIFENSVVGTGLELEYDITNDKTSFHFKYPDDYKNVSNVWYYSCSRTITANEIFAYTFAPSPYIHLMKENEVKKIPIISDYQNEVINFPTEAIMDLGATGDFYIENNTYLSIVYDKYQEVFYVFFGLPTKVIDESTGKKKTMDDKPFSILIYDKDFNKIGEYLPKENHYLYNTYFVDEKGLWISDNHVNNPNLDENKLSFRLFELVETNQ